MKVLHVIAGLSRKSGGPSRSSQGLVAALCDEGVDAWIYSFDGELPWVKGVRRFKVRRANVLTIEDIKGFDLIHIHGIWDWRLHNVAKFCQKGAVPYVISPRGMLEPWSLKQRRFKKCLARLVYQDFDLQHAAALHATALGEAEQFSRLGLKTPVILSSNAVTVPVARFCENRNRGGFRRALFVSRMHPKKGVMELVEAWARVVALFKAQRCQFRWQCELVYTTSSSEETFYEARVRSRIVELGLENSFIVSGPLLDDAKWNAYARADLFVLPTYSENFGIVVAEALWAGIPVITTKGTPWSNLEGSMDVPNSKCGWWIDLPPTNSLDKALYEACSMPPEVLAEMGRIGHELVLRQYTWKAVCKSMVNGYEKILKGELR